MRAIGIIIIACALAIVGISQLLNCEQEGRHMQVANGMSAPMRCYWTATAEIVTGVSLFVTGGLMAIGKRRDSPRNLAVIGTTLGAFTILIPTVLIGVCSDPMMDCDMIMKPTLILLGTIVSALCVGSTILSSRQAAQAA